MSAVVKIVGLGVKGWNSYFETCYLGKLGQVTEALYTLVSSAEKWKQYLSHKLFSALHEFFHVKHLELYLTT